VSSTVRHFAGSPVRLGAVVYLNARPLTWALDRSPSSWQVRYDVPSVCAELLHGGHVDLGLVPSIEYLHGSNYRLVPGVGIGSRGEIVTVALYTRKAIGDVRTIALDTSSRTSVALTRVLCEKRFDIAPEFVAHGPDLAAMMAICDAALLIGDPAFDANHEALNLEKIDLGVEWMAMTGLPFVYAAWTGRPNAVGSAHVQALQRAQEEGVAAIDAIAAEYGRGDEGLTRRAARYLRDNVKYAFGAEEAAGLQLFLDYAAEVGLGASRKIEFY
jgi:chorismate dehydratase